MAAQTSRHSFCALWPGLVTTKIAVITAHVSPVMPHVPAIAVQIPPITKDLAPVTKYLPAICRKLLCRVAGALVLTILTQVTMKIAAVTP